MSKSGAPTAEQASWLLGYFSGTNVRAKNARGFLFLSNDEKNLLVFEDRLLPHVSPSFPLSPAQPSYSRV